MAFTLKASRSFLAIRIFIRWSFVMVALAYAFDLFISSFRLGMVLHSSFSRDFINSFCSFVSFIFVLLLSADISGYICGLGILSLKNVPLLCLQRELYKHNHQH